jgi:predicted transcriptional regulator
MDGHCPGCGGGAGNQSCAIAKCSLQHETVEYCFLCPEYPCRRYEGIEEYDSFITHQRQLRDISRAQEIGIEAYNEEQGKKVKILQTLLSNYNDGRRKAFYCVAINLLPLQDIENAMKQVAENSSFNNLTIKEKAENIASIFQHYSTKQGIVLKLRKKPTEK